MLPGNPHVSHSDCDKWPRTTVNLRMFGLASPTWPSATAELRMIGAQAPNHGLKRVLDSTYVVCKPPRWPKTNAKLNMLVAQAPNMAKRDGLTPEAWCPRQILPTPAPELHMFDLELATKVPHRGRLCWGTA